MPLSWLYLSHTQFIVKPRPFWNHIYLILISQGMYIFEFDLNFSSISYVLGLVKVSWFRKDIYGIPNSSKKTNEHIRLQY